MKKTFAGGIRFKRRNDEYSELGKTEASTILLEAEEERLSSVKEGDTLKEGSLVFDKTGDLPAVYCGICGTVEKLESENGTVKVTIKKSDEDSEPIILDPLDKTLGEYSSEELSSLLMQTGVFPPEMGKKAAKFLTVDCGGSPYDISRLFLCINYPKQVIGGAKILMKLLGARKCNFAIPSSCLEAAQVIENNLASRGSVIKVALFNEKYPNAPQLTVCAISNLEIGAYRRPEDAGYPVVTPHLCYAAYQALASGVPFSSGLVSFTDKNELTTAYFVPFGASLHEVFDVPVGYKLVRAEKILGSPVSEDGRMEKGISALTVVKDEPYPIITERGCIGCRRCVDVCPGRLLPYQLYNAAEKGKLSGSLQNEVLSCFECGCCSAVCPSCLPIYELLSKSRKDYLSALYSEQSEREENEVEQELVEKLVNEPDEESAGEDVEKAKETVEEALEETANEPVTEEPELTIPEEVEAEDAQVTDEIISNDPPSKNTGKKKKKKKNKKAKSNDSQPQNNDESNTEKADLTGIFGEGTGGDGK